MHPANAAAPPSTPATAQDDLMPLHTIGCDPFEEALLPILRDLVQTCRAPDGRTWNTAYGVAAATWGPWTGLPLADGLARIAEALTRAKGARLHVLCETEAPEAVTRDERLLLLLLHQLRRSHTAAGYDFLMDLTDGKVDSVLMEHALDFAARHSCGPPRTLRHDGTVGPRLRVV